MNFYYSLIKIQWVSMLMVLLMCVVLPVICIIHCLSSSHSLKAKVIWCLALLFTLIFAAMAYMLVNASKHKWLGWLIGAFILLLLFNMAFPAAWHWYLVKDAQHQQARAQDTLPTLSTIDLTSQQRQHVLAFTNVSISVASHFHGSYTQAPPIAQRMLLDSVTYLRNFNALTKDGELTPEQYNVLFR